MTSATESLIVQMLNQMDARFTASIEEVKAANADTKRELLDGQDRTRDELSGQVRQVKQSVDAASGRINLQNGRVGKLEVARQLDLAALDVRERLHEKRWRRIRAWSKFIAACFIAGFGSLVLVILTHIWS